MLKLSPLDPAHRALGAKMGAFAGWDMPISYAGTLAEHAAVRERAGIFDVSHLGKLLVAGEGAAGFLDSQLTNRMTDLAPGRARYTLICDDNGGIVDDIIVYGLGAQEYLVVPNAGNRDEVAAILSAAAPPGVNVATLEWSTLAVQGPLSPEIVGAQYPFAKDLGYMQVARDGDVVVSRSGYSGERGYEIFTAAADAMDAWDALCARLADAGGAPCGLAARDTLRLEMGYPLHGNDIDRTRTPNEANLMWAVKLKDREFPGARAIRETTAARTLTGIRMRDRSIPRHGCAVVRDGAVIGEVTSGTFSPTLKIGIALAYVDAGITGEVEVDVRGKPGAGEIVTPPFVDRSPK
jgi:aminomethyltransferase